MKWWLALGGWMVLALGGADSAVVPPKTVDDSANYGQVFGLKTGYPGPLPGPTAMAVGEEFITVSNAALAVSWTWQPRGLKWGVVRDARSGTGLALTGEVFQIVLTNGQRYAASALAPETKPRVSELAVNPKAARLAARIPGGQVELPLRSRDGLIRATWRAEMREDGNYVRQELAVTATGDDCAIKEMVWLSEAVGGAAVAGSVDGSPLTAGPFFLGGENPMAVHSVTTGNQAACRLDLQVPLRRGETLTQSFVLGVAPAGQRRRAFLHYLERERAHPYRPFLHYNSWYDIAWQPFALNETNCLEAIGLWGERFIQPHGVVMDALVFDDGWDDPKTLWQFHRGFPRGFAPLVARARPYHTPLGVWLSPFGGYGAPRAQRLQFGAAQGFETNAAGFSLAGPKYYAAFKQACEHMIRQYGVNHFKFDGIAAGTHARGGANYARDTEAMRRLMLELRETAPDLYINLTTGSWPSPFWLRYADSVWRQGGDMGRAGKGSRQQQWLTYRDQEVYRNVVRRGPLYPLNSLMTQGVAYSRQGDAGDATFNAAGFKDDVRAFFGSGTGLQELYLQPGKLTEADWAVLAEAAKWSRANADVLVDTHWLGGDPAKLEIYGYASWAPRKGIVMLRNPDEQAGDIELELQAAFELPPGAPTRYGLKSPWREDAAQPVLQAEAGRPLRLRLKPFEVAVWEALPAP